MGAKPVVDLQEFETKNQISEFIEEVNNSTVELEKQNKKIMEEVDKRELNPNLYKLVELHYEAENICKAPRVVYWLSASKRKECQDAKMKAFSKFVEIANDFATINDLQQMSAKNEDHIKLLKSLSKVNSKHINNQ